MRAAIEVRGLSRSFGRVRAVDGLDFDVPTGSLFGFLGPNGAGKTTTIRLILGLLRADAGTVRLFDQPLTRDPALFSRIGAVVERPAFYPGLSARDNLRVFAATAGIRADQANLRVPQALQRVGLDEVADRGTRGFSAGMRQRLAIGLALLREPELVVLDEPTAGLDPAGVAEIRRLLATLIADGATVFLSSHVLHEVEQLCDRLAILDRGRMVAQGLTRDLLGRDVHLAVRFETQAETDRATAVLAASGWVPQRETDGTGLLVAGFGERTADIARTLGEAGLYPVELTERKPSLESVFLHLTQGGRATADREVDR